jgi:hypothetical protein
MSTYIYMMKATDRWHEDDRGKMTKLHDLTAEDIVRTVRAGPAMGTETTDPRGNLVTLESYRRRYPTWPEDLYLDNALGTPFALVIFGAAETGRSRTYRDLLANQTWMSIKHVRTSSNSLSAVAAEGTFGTHHTKYLLMIAAKDFKGFPKGARSLDPQAYGFIHPGTGWAYRSAITEYFRRGTV